MIPSLSSRGEFAGSTTEARLQQQQLVEGLKDVDGGLVDGADYGAAGVADVADGPHDDGRRARIQPRGGLVHKDDAGVGHQLHRDRQPLALLHAQPADPRQTNLAFCRYLHSSQKQLQRLGIQKARAGRDRRESSIEGLHYNVLHRKII